MRVTNLSDIGRTTLRSADDLYVFSQHLTKKGGFVAAVGGLLSVQAAIGGCIPPAAQTFPPRLLPVV